MSNIDTLLSKFYDNIKLPFLDVFDYKYISEK